MRGRSHRVAVQLRPMRGLCSPREPTLFEAIQTESRRWGCMPESAIALSQDLRGTMLALHSLLTLRSKLARELAACRWWKYGRGSLQFRRRVGRCHLLLSANSAATSTHFTSGPSGSPCQRACRKLWRTPVSRAGFQVPRRGILPCTHAGPKSDGDSRWLTLAPVMPSWLKTFSPFPSLAALQTEMQPIRLVLLSPASCVRRRHLQNKRTCFGEARTTDQSSAAKP